MISILEKITFKLNITTDFSTLNANKAFFMIHLSNNVVGYIIF